MKRLRNILPLLVILGGMLILFYPTISNFLIMRNASRAVNNYDASVEALSQEQYQKVLDAAHAYNEKLAQNDALTGLHSRTYFDIKLANIENKGIRPLCVISCDVNGLKLANDYMGHLVGDKLLQTVAVLCKESVRTSDCVARMGGDEIVILLPSCPREAGEEILAKLRQNFDRHNACSDQMPALVSFGLACAESADIPASAILVEADREMLKEKRSHRKAAHERIKQWIEQNMDVVVSLEDDRY